MRESHSSTNPRFYSDLTILNRSSWVVGALDSAWRAVYNYLVMTDESKIPKFFELWGKNAEWFEEQEASTPEQGGDRSHSLLEKFVRRTHGTKLT